MQSFRPFIYIVILLSILVCCTTHPEPEKPSGRTLTATLAPETRTSLDGLSVLWSESDVIGVFSDGTVYPFDLVGGAGEATATFHGDNGPSGTSLKAYYPYEGAGAFSGTSLAVTLPGEQAYNADSFADGVFPSAGVSTNGTTLAFSHLCAVLRLDLKGSGKVQEVSVEALGGESLCGDGTVSFEGTPSLSVTGDNVVTLVCDTPVTLSETATPFLIAIPAGTYAQGFEITVRDIYGATVTRRSSASATLAAGHLRSFAAALSLTATVPDETVLYTWTCDASIATNHPDYAASYTSGTTSAKVYDDTGNAWWEYVCDGQSRPAQAYAISTGDYQYQASPSYEDDAFLFTLPVTNLPAGSVLCLKGGLQAYTNGTPDVYKVEYLDDGVWKHSQTITMVLNSGKAPSVRTEINAPARFSAAVSTGSVQMRILHDPAQQSERRPHRQWEDPPRRTDQGRRLDHRGPASTARRHPCRPRPRYLCRERIHHRQLRNGL